jgi:uncharacterized protein with HEPN domain
MSAIKDYPKLMKLHCDKIIFRLENLNRQNWMEDEILRDAVCMRLLSLADCIKEYLRVNPEITDQNPNIPWDEIIRFRDKIAHHYHGIDHDIVWQIIQSDIKPLHEAICRLSTSSSTNHPHRATCPGD